MDLPALRDDRLALMSLYDHAVPVSLIVVAARYVFGGTAGVYRKTLCLRVSNHCSESDGARLKHHYL